MKFITHVAPLAQTLMEEISALSEQVFSPPAIDCEWRLTNMPRISVFCARERDRLIGFKAGYAIAERKYYSWLGAVHPNYRRQGIASQLARRQQEWLVELKYSFVETSCKADNEAMAQINLASGFSVVGTKLEPHGLQMLWSKDLA